MSKILTVFGATGYQGGSVVRSVLVHPTLSKQYTIRAVTRDPSKPAAKALAERGVEVVQGDLNDKKSIRDVVAGSHTVFGSTDFLGSFSKDTEVTQGRNIADACKENGVSHLIWSSLPHASKISNGAIQHMQHSDSKAEVEQYIRDLGIPATFFYAGSYMSNFRDALQKSEDGYALINNFRPDTKIPLFEAEHDTGKFIAGILSHTSEPAGQMVTGASDWYTPMDIVSTIERVSGKKTTFTSVPDDVIEGMLPPQMAKLLAETFKFIREYGYYGPGGEQLVEESYSMLDEKPTSFEDYVKRTWPWK